MDKARTIEVINELLKELGMDKAKQLSDSLGIARPQWLYDVLNESKQNVGLSRDRADLICEKFPHINKLYLLTGEGNLVNRNPKEIQGIQERLDIFLSYLGIDQASFEYNCGITNEDANNGINSIILSKITNAYPELNMRWLLLGVEEMLVCSTERVIIKPVKSKENDLPILDIRVCAGHGIGLEGNENRIIGYVNVPEFSGCLGITVYGDSMYDKYSAGDILFVRQIREKSMIENGQPYVIITREDRLLKMIYYTSDCDKITLVSYNNSFNPDGRRKYPDMDIPKSEILFLYKIVGKLARTQL